MEINNKTIWRIAAIAATFIWAIILHVFTLPMSSSLFQLDFSIIIYYLATVLLVLSLMVSIALIVFPMQFYLHAIMCCLWGLSALINEAHMHGILLYLLGCAVVYSKQLSSNRDSKHKSIKYILLIAPLLIVILFQSRLGETVLFESMLNLLLLLVFFTCTFFLVIKPFIKKNIEKHLEYANTIDLSGLTAEEILLVKAMVANKTFNPIGHDTQKISADAGKIDLRKLPTNELLMLKDVLNNKTLFAIGQDNNLRESTIKRQMSSIYKKLGIYGRSHLLDLHRDGKLIFPE